MKKVNKGLLSNIALAVLLSAFLAQNLQRLERSDVPLPVYVVKSVKTLTELPVPEQVAARDVFVWPIHHEDYVAKSNPFGEQVSITIGGYGDGYHDGLDIYGLWLARIICSFGGEVVCHFPAPNGYWNGHDVLGGLIIIRAIFNNQVYFFKYGHMVDTTVHEGDVVSTSTFLGRQGNTGKSDGDHLHFEVILGGDCNRLTVEIIGGKKLNPLWFMREPI